MLELIKTGDGSNTLYNKKLNEYYHSRYGAIAESSHVFIEAGLHFALKAGITSFRILEVGFGTGLNAYLTYLKTSLLNIPVYYHTIEPFPLPEKIWKQLNYAVILGNQKKESGFSKLHRNEWDKENTISQKFRLFKQKLRLDEVELTKGNFHLVYFDAFAPDIQPELWTYPTFCKIFDSLKEKGILTTYSAKGEVRRNLQRAGFATERLPGPKGKHEMLRAIKISG